MAASVPEEFDAHRKTKWAARLPSYFTNKNARLVMKLDLCLLVWAFISGLTKDMDQSATTQAYVSGWKESLQLNGNELVEFTTFFSIGYAIAIIPAQLIQTMLRPSLFLPVCEIIWGLMTMSIYACKDVKSVYAVRFFTGVFEATSWPGLVALIFNWYTEPELAKRLAIFGVSDMAGNMFLSIVQAALYKNLNGVRGLEGWQWLFIVSGCMAIAWGIIGFIAIPDSPAITRAIWLTPTEREAAWRRMNEQGTTVQKFISWKTLRNKMIHLLKSPLTYFFLVAYLQFAWSTAANSYFLLYLKSLMNSQGNQLYSTYEVNLIPLGGYAISIVCNLGLNALSDATRWRWQISIFAATIQVICCTVLSAWPASRAVVMTFYFLTFSTEAWGYAITAWIAEILRKEPEARSALIGIAVTLVYVGHATIPLRAWRVSDSPRYPIGFPLSAAFAAGSIVAILGMYFWVRKHPEFELYGFEDNLPLVDEIENNVEEIDVDDKRTAAATSKQV